VIFMITAPMLSQGVKVELPQADSTPIPQEEREPLVVTVNGAGEYFMSLGGLPNVPLEVAAIPARLQAVLAAQPGLPVYVKGDRTVAYGTVVALMALIQGAGVATVGLMTESPQDGDGR
jgi:biopolymer transport protein TolR